MSPFWSYTKEAIDAAAFNTWYVSAAPRDISPKFGDAFFRAQYKANNSISANLAGELVFIRDSSDAETHSMLELSVNNQPVGNFIDYADYRHMGIGILYDIEFEVLVGDAAWINSIPWLIVYQGHAAPDVSDEGKAFNPPFALVISEGNWRLDLRADSRLSLPQPVAYERQDFIIIGSVAPDAWTKFRIQVIWGYESVPDIPSGSMSVWVDGVLQHSENGVMNTYNNETVGGEKYGPYTTFGAYTSAVNLGADQATIRFRKLKVSQL